VYIHFIQGDAPAPLTLPSATAPSDGQANGTAQTTGGTNGTWDLSNDSIVGYRVREVLFGQSADAVGRTSDVIGSITVNGTTITAGTFTVDMTTVRSDESRRDEQFNGRIMETSTYPSATFRLTKPIDLGSIPAKGTDRTVKATGNLTLHGVTRTVEFALIGQYTGSAHPGGRIDSHHVHRLQHRQPQLRAGDHSGPRRAGVRAELHPRVTRLAGEGSVSGASGARPAQRPVAWAPPAGSSPRPSPSTRRAAASCRGRGR
jgi:polyisoprenoid-binding protein YceI